MVLVAVFVYLLKQTNLQFRISLLLVTEVDNIINPLTKFLFGSYPREAGNPNRIKRTTYIKRLSIET
ncbi:unnamed protein product, partial [marine sediment metagenome]